LILDPVADRNDGRDATYFCSSAFASYENAL
jgi:hypothetical protein